MDAKGYKHWQEIESDQKRRGLKDYEYCLREGLDRRWLEGMRREAGEYELQRNLFVELEPEDPQARRAVSGVSVSCQDALFHLEPGFDAETFKRALRAVREAS
jgi:hypothetical protein